VRAGHQSWTRGDLIARDFIDESDEAAWICDRIQAMRGLAFQDTADAEARGLSWSDFAVLFRSVGEGRRPLVAQMRRRDIPYVVKGLNRLFDSPEIAAVVGVFRYMAGLIEATDLRVLWEEADLLPANGDWTEALTVLDEGSRLRSRRALGRLQHPAAVPRVSCGARPARGDGSGRPGTGASSSSISSESSAKRSRTSRQSTSTLSPHRSTNRSRTGSSTRLRTTTQSRTPDVGYATPDAVTLTTVHQAKGMQWPAVFIPCLRKNRFPSKAARRARPLPRHSRGSYRRC